MHRRLMVGLIWVPAFVAPASAQIGQAYPSRVVNISGECEAELRPAKAVVAGGVAVSALKPSNAVDQLDKQMALIRNYVRQNQARAWLNGAQEPKTSYDIAFSGPLKRTATVHRSHGLDEHWEYLYDCWRRTDSATVQAPKSLEAN